MSLLQIVQIAAVILVVTAAVGFRREVFLNGMLMREDVEGEGDFFWKGGLPHFNFVVKGGTSPDLMTVRWHFGWFCWERKMVVDGKLSRQLSPSRV